MHQHTTITRIEQLVTLKTSESFVRGKIRGLPQEIPDEKVTKLLGRAKSERKKDVDASLDLLLPVMVLR